MKVLCLGDVCGNAGCAAVQKALPEIKRKYKIDLTIVNGENSAEGNGILPKNASVLFSAGTDVITGGNHSLRRREIFDELEENPSLLRPANYPDSVPGKGVTVIDMGKTSVAVVNISGVVFLDNLNDPFRTFDKIYNSLAEKGIKNIIVDFHAEATSEKRAFGFYADGRATAVFGTHTHVLTADNQVLPNGTGYVTDIGMCGPKNSVLGVKKEIVISRFLDKISDRFIIETEPPMMINGCVFTVDELTGKCVNTEIINLTV